MKKQEKVFCVACCKDLEPSEFTIEKEKYICDKCCEGGLRAAFWFAEQITGKRQLVIEGRD